VPSEGGGSSPPYIEKEINTTTYYDGRGFQLSRPQKEVAVAGPDESAGRWRIPLHLRGGSLPSLFEKNADPPYLKKGHPDTKF